MLYDRGLHVKSFCGIMKCRTGRLWKGRKMAKDVDVKSGEVTQPRPFERFIQYVQDRAEVDSAFNAGDDLVESQADKILTAENADALFEAMELTGLGNFQSLDNGTEVTINDFRLVKSARDDLSGKLKAFAIINVIDNSTGEELALNTSILRIVSFLRMAEVMQLLPVQVRIVKSVTANGNEVITLAKIKSKLVKTETA
jgi:hypothetical protein